MAQKKPEATEDADQQATAKLSATLRGRVLRDCAYGKPDDVVEINADLVESLFGVVDTDPAAVAYAESIKKD